jgi:hypothetical protein
MLPPAQPEPSQRLLGEHEVRNLPTCRTPKHTRTQALWCTRGPTRPTLENESRAADRQWKKSTGDHGSHTDRNANSGRSPSLD